ncbi:MAG: PEGA domain-containing protein [Sphaerochaetaceae bacterium]|nr:PEGA domain-containing protein [Sphaerochaetaceae bacterium]
MKKTMLFILAVVCVLVLSSCATMFSDDYETVTFSSDPSGATVKIDGAERGTTPTALVLRTDRTYVVEVSKEGYRPQIATISKNVKWGWQLVDFFVWPVIGNVVDFINADGYTLDPTNVVVYLPKE